MKRRRSNIEVMPMGLESANFSYRLTKKGSRLLKSIDSALEALEFRTPDNL